MQACIYEQYGPASVVRVGEVATPRPRPHELLVRVRAAAVTTADWRFRSSTFPLGFRLLGRLMVGLLRPRKPILGMDFSGVVEATGSAVSQFRVGDEVFGATSAMRLGTHAEYVTVSESAAILPKPAFLQHEEAAAIPFGACSALAFLRDVARVEAGQRVLIVGASGNVGAWAVQLARQFGAEVTGVCSTPNVELVESLGAHRVIDYTSGEVAQVGAGYDLVFDTVGVTTFSSMKPLLAPKGVYLPLNNGLREMVQALATVGSPGKKMKVGISENSRESLVEIVHWIAARALRPVIDRVYPMSEIVDAHRHVEGRHKRGSVVVSFA